MTHTIQLFLHSRLNVYDTCSSPHSFNKSALRFDDIVDTYEPTATGTEDNVFVTRSYDATSHFEFESREVMDLYERITGSPLDLNMSMEELQKQASQ